MLVGTLFGVLVIPGLYFVFAKIAEGRKLIRDEDEAPLTEAARQGGDEDAAPQTEAAKHDE